MGTPSELSGEPLSPVHGGEGLSGLPVMVCRSFPMGELSKPGPFSATATGPPAADPVDKLNNPGGRDALSSDAGRIRRAGPGRQFGASLSAIDRRHADPGQRLLQGPGRRLVVPV